MASAYTPTQISQILSHIGLANARQLHYTGDSTHDLHSLAQLVIHVMSSVPYENLSIHYSADHTISLDPQTLFEKIVSDDRGRGGYCMEVAIFFNHLLRGLSFPVYTSAVRARARERGVPYGPYRGWTHIINLVTLANGSKYMLDVACGGDGPCMPIPLAHNQPRKNLGSQEIRLRHDHIPTQTIRSDESRLWIYSYRNGPEMDWIDWYAFGEVEAMASDFDLINYYTSTSPLSWHTSAPLAVKFLRRLRDDSTGEYEIYSKNVVLNDELRQNLGGKTQLIKKMSTESERVQVLSEWLGIGLTNEERNGITGRTSALSIPSPQESETELLHQQN